MPAVVSGSKVIGQHKSCTQIATYFVCSICPQCELCGQTVPNDRAGARWRIEYSSGWNHCRLGQLTGRRLVTVASAGGAPQFWPDRPAIIVRKYRASKGTVEVH